VAYHSKEKPRLKGVFLKEMKVKTTGPLKDWAKEMDQGDYGPPQKLTITHTQLTSCTIPAPRKGHCQRPFKDSVVQGTPNGQKFGKRCWAQPEFNVITD
jgi:hypothetical protein